MAVLKDAVKILHAVSCYECAMCMRAGIYHTVINPWASNGVSVPGALRQQ